MRTIPISKSISAAVEPSQRVLEVAAMFGLGVDAAQTINIVPRCDIPLPHLCDKSGVVFITGPSGSGKSTILKLLAEAIEPAALSIVATHPPGLESANQSKQCGSAVAVASSSAAVDHAQQPNRSRCLLLRFDNMPSLPETPLVDLFAGDDLPLERALMFLSLAGLNEAFVMLRKPAELSDGQRYRLRVAHVMALIWQKRRSIGRAAVIADEFGSTLDRITAKTISRNVRRWLSKHAPLPVSFICATTHDDLLEDLQPDVLVWKGFGEDVEVVTR